MVEQHPSRPGRRRLAAIALSLACFGLPISDSRAGKPLKVATTIGHLADAVRVIGGSAVEVSALIDTGVDHRTYNHTEQDLGRLRDADLELWIGLGLEGRLAGLFKGLRRRQPVVAVGELIERSNLLPHPSIRGEFDPHIWMDADIWSDVVRIVEAALSKLRPDHAQLFAERAAAYRQELDELNAYVAGAINSVPEEQRVILSAHDGFRYFGRAYGIEVLGVQGLSTDSKTASAHLDEIVNLIVERKLQAVFVETTVAEQHLREVIEGAEAEGREIIIGGTLFSEALGTPGTYEGTYIGMLDHNATLISRALGGVPSRHGFQGKLSNGQ
ncbi:MAG: metal ABC transporter solute-binding protein, Zn/Mn family [Geminicoccaceae bacterium]